MFDETILKTQLPQAEEKILQDWKSGEVFQKSLALRSGAKPFIFFEGPPTANGKPGVHHVLSRIMKDVFCRYKSMDGFYVGRKAGWDTHGLPVELEVEKELKLSSKSEIEKYSVLAFNRKCRDSVLKYEKDWRELTERIGYWLDMDHPYVTYSNEYIQSVWWIVQQFYKQNMVYKGKRTVPYCPRCGTPLSSHEVAQGYKDVKDPSLFIKFKARREDFSFLVWTTTPWTLPANIALAVHAESSYLKVSVNGEQFIVAEALAAKVINDEFRVLEKLSGRELTGIEYEPLLDFGLASRDEQKKGYRVFDAEFVTLSDGTGIVHIAPAFGEDDCKLGRAHELAFLQPVDLEGKFTAEVKPWAGLFVKKADPKIIKYLQDAGKLLKTELYQHSYPFCWRCDTPLLYYGKSAWYFKTTAYKEMLLECNQSINWKPEHIKNGRFGNWLENNVDWSISRERYWGTPLNIWECEKCQQMFCPGSLAELQERVKENIAKLDLHKPFIDEILVACSHCKGAMKRTPEVLDAWLDSGSMPLAQWGYPHQNKELFESNFPADFIAEAIDQTRGWFYSLLAVSSLLFKESPFKNCLVLGHIQDSKGQKMSKSRGNAVDPWKIMEEHGADSLRWYMFRCGSPWDNMRFNQNEVKEIHYRFFVTLKNIVSFFVLYANIDALDRSLFSEARLKAFVPNAASDRWILSKYTHMVGLVRQQMDAYDVNRAAKAIDVFIDQLSNWYVRVNRRRFWASGLERDKVDAYQTLYLCIHGVAKVMAPFTPFWSEMINRVLNGNGESIHLTDYPRENLVWKDPEIEREMDFIKDIVSLGRSIRNKTALKVRQPLAELIVIAEKKETFDPEKTLDVYRTILVDELNIKKITLRADKASFVTFRHQLDFKKAGPKYGSLVKTLAHMVATLSPPDSQKLFTLGSLKLSVEGQEIDVASEDVIRSVEAMGAYSAAEEGGLLVLLCTELTKELIEEGLAREMVNKIQFLRKESGFDVMDRIALQFVAEPSVEAALLKHREFICDEILAKKFEAVKSKADDFKEIKLNNWVIHVRIERVVV